MPLSESFLRLSSGFRARSGLIKTLYFIKDAKVYWHTRTSLKDVIKLAYLGSTQKYFKYLHFLAKLLTIFGVSSLKESINCRVHEFLSAFRTLIGVLYNIWLHFLWPILPRFSFLSHRFIFSSNIYLGFFIYYLIL